MDESTTSAGFGPENLGETLDRILRFAKENDGISHKTLYEFLGKCSDDAINHVTEVLGAMGIKVGRDDNQEDSEDPDYDPRSTRRHIPNSFNPVGMYLQQLASAPLLTKDEERMWFQIIDASSEKVCDIFNRFLFAAEMYMCELQRLSTGDRYFDSIVSEDAKMRCAAYKKLIPDLCKSLTDASDKLAGAGALYQALGDSALGELRTARQEMREKLRKLSFRQSVVEAFCDIAYEDIYCPYMACKRKLEAPDSSGPSGSSGLDKDAAARKAELEAIFGMSPEEFVASFDEMRDVLKVIQAARTKIIESNMRLVVHVAKKYINRGIDLSDLLQDGSIGLMTAVRKFDRLRGHKFSTYATWWIRQTISRSLTNNSRTIRVPSHMVDMLNKMNTMEKALTQELGRAPRACELAERMKTKPEKIRQLRELRQQVVSLDSAVSEDNDTTIEEITSDTSIESPVETVDRNILKDTVHEALSVLNDREKIVIALRYGLTDGNQRTLEEIGKVFNVTREHIRKIEIEALQKLRESDSLGKLAALAAEI